MTIFATLRADGTVEKSRDISVEDIRKCPHVIFVADHYREDGTCKCNDPTATEMAEWGYTWDGSLWQNESSS